MPFHYLAMAIADAVEAHYTVLVNALNGYRVLCLGLDDSDAFEEVWGVYADLKTKAEYAAEDTLIAAIQAQYGRE